MKKFLGFTVAAVVAVSMLTSCGSSSNASKDKAKGVKFSQQELDAAFISGNFAKCSDLISVRKADAVLNGFDSAMFDYLKKDYMASSTNFVGLQQMMSDLSKDVTAGKSIQAALAGENSVTYTGSSYEKILAYSMKIVNALKMGEIDRAVGTYKEYVGNYMTEIQTLRDRENEIVKACEGADKNENVQNAFSVLSKLGFNINIDSVAATIPAASTTGFYENSAFLYYLASLVYAANDDSDHAADAAAHAVALNPAIDLTQDVSVPEGKGRIDVIALSDVIGKRQDSNNKMITLSTGNEFLPQMNFKLAYPVFKAQNHPVQVKSITLSDGTVGKIMLIEDFDNAVKIDVDFKARSAANRSLVRNITKNATALSASFAALVAAKTAVDKANGNALQLAAAKTAYLAAQKGINVALEKVVAAEVADVRQAAYFPNKASAAGFTVEPGKYSATVEYSNGNKDVIQNIVVVAGKPTIVVSDCISPVKTGIDPNAK